MDPLTPLVVPMLVMLGAVSAVESLLGSAAAALIGGNSATTQRSSKSRRAFELELCQVHTPPPTPLDPPTPSPPRALATDEMHVRHPPTPPPTTPACHQRNEDG
jgi:hypothetical protein